jgi:hypothetical protein
MINGGLNAHGFAKPPRIDPASEVAFMPLRIGADEWQIPSGRTDFVPGGKELVHALQRGDASDIRRLTFAVTWQPIRVRMWNFHAPSNDNRARRGRYGQHRLAFRFGRGVNHRGCLEISANKSTERAAVLEPTAVHCHRQGHAMRTDDESDAARARAQTRRRIGGRPHPVDMHNGISAIASKVRHA